MPNTKKKPNKKPSPRGELVAALGEFRPRGRERWGMFLIGYAVACYIAFVICSKIFLALPLREGLWVYLLFPALAPGIYWLMGFALRWFWEDPASAGASAGANAGANAGQKKKKAAQTQASRRAKIAPVILPVRAKLSPAVFFGAFLAVFAVCLVALLAFYPGHYLHPDIRAQWEQVRTGEFIAWHPPIHTMIIWLVTRIHYGYGTFIAVQILFYSLLCGYMAAAMRAWGLGGIWTALFVAAAICAHKTLLYAFKDSLFTCFVLWGAVCLLNIALSRGEWLGKWGNRAALAVSMAFASLIRANGYFFTLPVLVLLFVLYGKRRAVASAVSGALAVLIIAGIQGPLYKAAGVYRVTKSMAFILATYSPMVVLGSIYKEAPEALDADGVRFMRFLAAPERWEQQIAFGVGNGMFTMFPSTFENTGEVQKKKMEDYLSYCPPEKLAPMLLHAIKNQPTLAAKALGVSSRPAWDPTDFKLAGEQHDEIFRGFAIEYQDNETVLSILTRENVHPQLLEETLAASKSAFLRAFQGPYRVIDGVLRWFLPGYLPQCIGFNMLALALCLWFSLRRRRGWTALLLTLPSLAYVLGTAVLTAAQDYRQFHFTAVILVPLVLACLAKTREAPKRNEATKT